MEGEDIQNDGTEHQQAQIPRAGNGDEEAADQFADFHEREVAGGREGRHEMSRRRALSRRFGSRTEVEKHHHGGADKQQPKDGTGNGRDMFHRSIRLWFRER